jgi:hypothetical protein
MRAGGARDRVRAPLGAKLELFSACGVDSRFQGPKSPYADLPGRGSATIGRTMHNCFLARAAHISAG